MKPCLVEECKNAHKARGYCVVHYQQFQRTGHILSPRTVDVLERLIENTTVTPSGCFEFQLLQPDGYGRIWLEGKNRPAHRVAYEVLVGPIPDGLQLDHLCRNRACWNIGEHIEPVTPKVNTLRSRAQSAINARKSHCLRGHSLIDLSNVYICKKGKRHCRTCRQEAKKRWQEKRMVAQID